MGTADIFFMKVVRIDSFSSTGPEVLSISMRISSLPTYNVLNSQFRLISLLCCTLKSYLSRYLT